MPPPREDLIASAVNFLQDPSVAASPLDKRKAFLESKNLTPDEVEIALARAGDPGQAMAPPPPPGYGYAQRPPPGYGYGYPPYGQWPQQPEPRRDWRDYFIMATVTSAVGWGLYTVAKRYVVPLIAPPTPPQIEQDKAAIDAEFSKAFALIDQLAKDTEQLKTAEEERTQKLDAALADVEAVIGDLKQANQRREDDARRLGDEIREIKKMIPKALDAWKVEGDNRLKEVGTELKSLKVLVGNRVGAPQQQQQSHAAGSSSSSSSAGFGVGTSSTAPASRTVGNGLSAYANYPGSPPPTVDSSAPATASAGKPAETSAAASPQPTPSASNVQAPKLGGSGSGSGIGSGEGRSSPFSFENKPGRAIPAWQLAASAANGTATGSSSSNGTSAGASTGKSAMVTNGDAEGEAAN